MTVSLCAYWHLRILFSKMSIYVFCPFYNWIVWLFFTVWFWEFLIYSRCPSFGSYVAFKYFHPVWIFFFHSPCKTFTENISIILTKFMVSVFPFINCVFGVKSQNFLASTRFPTFSLMFFSKILIFIVLHLCLSLWYILS